MSLTADKSKEVQSQLEQMVEAQGVKVLHISAFGFKYDSAFWIAVSKDSERDRLVSDNKLLEGVNAVFVNSGYQKIIEDIWNKEINNPVLGYLKKLSIVFQSQETVDREYKGNWYYAMK